MKAKVLQLLRTCEDHFVSGEHISNQLSISRTMVWKYIDALRKEGYVIKAVSNKGYHLVEEMDVVNEHAIRSRLEVDAIFQNIIYEDTVTSTQQVAYKLLGEGAPHGTLIVANEQTSGRGRLGREWYSPANTGIWMSLIMRPNIEMQQTPQLTLVAAVALARAIKEATNYDVQIKWPNDLIFNGKKIAGILTEMQSDPDRVKSVIIGIGINVNQQTFPESIANIASSLSLETRETFHRVAIIEHFLREFQWLYHTYLEKGFSFIKPLWEARAISIGEEILAKTANGELKGVAEGISDEGVLLLKDSEGNSHRIYSADIHLLEKE
ncbi:biotin--[acetyl-CoA-carboxylase] ligase [Evansella cellulosilytica]|uniref:Bifunctional ligase/repressor BirA n=1 Tax=Evansella cellulosilytica (strain ATCC 21833 / DSM 2522 / FERM P-1141 / JCM 9156 / N-4) TaxID=649639 RepID=E6TZJ0_EVAC2|nr:biotin--[acetyl-CoA-carboxylase] ligase [Evansella cellulosilytica]ADU30164.1 biotin/acetyl-CoA-carboxylase ligase [Evansella cellulosilytica DSM 2522]